MSEFDFIIPKRIRPSSAAGNLQSHPNLNTGLYDNKRPLLMSAIKTEKEQLLKRPMSHIGGHPKYITPKDETHKLQSQRRPTLEIVDGIGETRKGQYDLRDRGFLGLSGALKEKIEERIDLDILESLHDAFKEADYDRSGKLSLDEFKILLREQLGITRGKKKIQQYYDQQIDALFHKIDWSSDGNISWNEFCTYMQLEYKEKEEAYTKAREISFNLPAKVETTPHRDNVVRITDTPDGNFIAGSTEGLMSFWSSSLESKKIRSVVIDQSSQRKSSGKQQKWITDFLVLNEFNKILISTGERELEFFELSSFEPYCRIQNLDIVPLRLDYCVSPDNTDECMIFWGDRIGCVNIFILKATGECLRDWKKRTRKDGIATIPLREVLNNPSVEFIRWQVHNDWVYDLKYYNSLRQVISCSNNESNAVVIGCIKGSTDMGEVRDTSSVASEKVNNAMLKRESSNLNSMMQPKLRLSVDQTVFRVYKGVRTFDFNKTKNILVTGGMDHLIRTWNPYVNLKPTGMLRGHNAPLVYLKLVEDEDWLFSISTDKCVKVWNIHDQNCLLTVRPKSHKIRGDLQACHFSNVSKSLMVATDQVSMLNIKLKPVVKTDTVLTHNESVNCIIYNPTFNHIITCTENSTVKLWDADSGNALFEYSHAHDDFGITCCSLDSGGKRLITGARNGALKIWNYNNGNCLRELKKQDNNTKTDHSIYEVTAVKYVQMSRNKFIISVGWDRCINLYIDSAADLIQQIQYPQPKWPDDVLNGHREDILSLAMCLPNLLATGDYGGTVLIWNMLSGHVLSKLIAPLDPLYIDESLDGDLSISKLHFLSSRVKNKESGILVSSGPRGLVHIWNVHRGGRLMAKFQGYPEKGHMISALCSGDLPDKPDSRLFVADKFGFISVWNVEEYCLTEPEDNPPELLQRWRGHTQLITGIQVINAPKILITSSTDFTVRIWTWEGHFVGTLGQQDPFDLWDPTTFQHPMVPYDVLIDPKSLPSHEYLNIPDDDTKRKKHPKERRPMYRDENEKEKEDLDEEARKKLFIQTHKFEVNDETIAQQIREKFYKDGQGKRLRHMRLRPQGQDKGGPSVYELLPVYKLEKTPDIDYGIIARHKEREQMAFLD